MADGDAGGDAGAAPRLVLLLLHRYEGVLFGVNICFLFQQPSSNIHQSVSQSTIHSFPHFVVRFVRSFVRFVLIHLVLLSMIKYDLMWWYKFYKL